MTERTPPSLLFVFADQMRGSDCHNFGTVEVRAMDSQTRVEHTLAIAALIQAMAKELAEHYEAGKQLAKAQQETLDAAEAGVLGDHFQCASSRRK